MKSKKWFDLKSEFLIKMQIMCKIVTKGSRKIETLFKGPLSVVRSEANPN